jgi:Sulfotransferase domain
MLVLVLGLCRTGTTSIKVALKKLGYKDVYDTQDIWERDHSTIWSKAIEAKFQRQEHIDFKRDPFTKVLQNYDVSLLMPC